MLKQLIDANIGRILLAYLLVIVRYGIWVTRPIVVGRCIEELIPSGTIGHWCLGLCILELAGAFAGWAAHRYDTRVFAAICYRLAALIAIKEKSDLSVAVGRSKMASALSRLFECTIPTAVGTIVNLGASICMLIVCDWVAGLLATASLFILVFVVHWIARQKTAAVQKRNDLAEADAAVIAQGPPDRIHTHFGSYATLAVWLSDKEANGFTAFDLVSCTTEIVVTVFVALTTNSVALTYASYNYAKNTSGAALDIKVIMDELVEARDVLARIEPR